MTPSELYKLWAPEASIWSNWAKPVLFADQRVDSQEPDDAAPEDALLVAWEPTADSRTAIILDLPGPVGVEYGLALSLRGFRPVPLYNGVPGPSPIIAVEDIISALQTAADALAALRLPPDAPPVFLLDSRRLDGGGSVQPGLFDNRWYVFPQDFPSANFLLSHGIQSVVLGQIFATRPHEDLAHVLLRWQEAGIQILSCNIQSQAQPEPLQVQRPDKFRALWYRALALAGLQRNSTGGFGAVVPLPSSGGGYG